MEIEKLKKAKKVNNENKNIINNDNKNKKVIDNNFIIDKTDENNIVMIYKTTKNEKEVKV